MRTRLATLVLVAALAGCGGGSDSGETEPAPRTAETAADVDFTAKVRSVSCGETTARSPEEDDPLRYCTAVVALDGPPGAGAAFDSGDHRLVVGGREVPADATRVAGSEARVSFLLDELDAVPSALVLDLGDTSERVPVEVEEVGYGGTGG